MSLVDKGNRLSGRICGFLLAAGVALIWSGVAFTEAGLPATARYTTFDNKPVELRPYVGRNIALLLDPSRVTDRAVVDRIVSAVDRAWDWYRGYFGRSPANHWTHAGKTSIAEVSGACGVAAAAATSACGFLGLTGIEVSTATINRLLLEAHGDRYNQAVFYELGRNFWFFGDQLEAMPKGAFTTGFAHIHRFYSMEAAGLVGAPWDDNLDFDGFRHAVLVDLLDRYLADPTLTWQNTLAVDRLPAKSPSWMVGNQLAAAFFHRIRRDHGHAGYRRFWQLMAKAPKANTPREAAARFVQVAHAATGEDYRSLLRDMSLPLKR